MSAPVIPTGGTLFPGVFPKPIVMTFDQRQGSSDGGALLLRAIDLRLGLIARLAACVPDTRQPGKVAHDIAALVAQRVYGIACGYADANDAARIHKLLLGRDPLDGPALASQPTLSRFENSIASPTLYRMAEALADHVIERHRRRLRGRVRRVTIDLDPTDDPTHGAQQLTFFNSHYDAWCYLPLVAFLSFNKERAQYLVAAVLRPGNVGAKVGAIAILERLLTRLRHAFPQARIRVRLDGGVAGPDILPFLDAQPEVDYVVALAKNDVLLRLAEPAMKQARRLSKQIGRTAHVYGEGRYAAQSWHGRTRRVIFKAEVVAPRRPRPQGQPAVRPHQHPAELRPVPGESVPRPPDRHRLRPVARAAAAGDTDRVCAGASRHLTRAVAETRRVRGTVGAPHRHPSPSRVSVP